MSTTLATSAPTKAEKAWREWVRDQGCVLGYPGPVQIHHVVGRTAKNLRVPIGHWLILPCTEQAHREVERLPKSEQIELFLGLCERYLRVHYELPFSAEVLLAIVRWRR